MKRSYTLSALGGDASVGGLDPTYAGTTPVEPWVRDPMWLALPTLGAAEEKIVALVAVFANGANVLALRTLSSCNVNWGDGTSSLSTGAQLDHAYDYNAIAPQPDEVELGYRQVIVTITPTAATWTALVELLRTPTDLTIHYPGYLEIKVNSPTLPSLTIGGGSVSMPFLQHVDINCPNMSSFNGGLSGCVSLRKVTRLVFKQGFVASMQSWFSECRSLEESPALNCAGVTSLNSLFFSCTNLRKFGALTNTGSITDFSSMFSGCAYLKEAPLLNTAAATNMSNMFQNCTSLVLVAAYNTANVTNMSNMFLGCTALVEMPLFDTAKVTNFSSMFQDCRSLRKARLSNTNKGTNFSSMHMDNSSLESVDTYDLVLATSVVQMFSGCKSLRALPALNMPLVTSLLYFARDCFTVRSIGTLTTGAPLTSLQQAFESCQSLQELPVITNTANVTNWISAFQYCYLAHSAPTYNTVKATTVQQMLSQVQLLSIWPALNLSAITSAAGMSSLTSSMNITRFLATGMKFSFSLANQRLNAAGLNEVFGNLASVVGQTITITGNPGAATCDRSIATAKGWTVTG